MSWQWLPLDEVLVKQGNRKKIQQGWSPQCLDAPAPDGAWGVLKTTAIQAGRFEPQHNKELPAHLEPRPQIEVKAGDVLLTCAGPRARCGVPALVRSTRGRLMMSGKMYRFRPDERLDSRFLEYWLLSPTAQRSIDSMKTGISDSGLNLTHARFVRLSVPVPTIEEQRHIIDKLDDHFSRLDAADAYLNAAGVRESKLYEAILDSALEDANTELVPLAGTLRDRLANGRSVPTRPGGFPVLRLTALRGDDVDLSERKEGAWTHADASRFLIKRGDFLISRGNGTLRLVGRGGLVRESPDPVAYPDTLIRARFDLERIDPDYLSIVWNSRGVRRQIEAAARTTAGIYKINQKDLEGIVVPIATIAEQSAVVARVRSSRDGLAELVAGRARTVKRMSALRRALLDSVFDRKESAE